MQLLHAIGRGQVKTDSPVIPKGRAVWKFGIELLQEPLLVFSLKLQTIGSCSGQNLGESAITTAATAGSTTSALPFRARILGPWRVFAVARFFFRVLTVLDRAKPHAAPTR